MTNLKPSALAFVPFVSVDHMMKLVKEKVVSPKEAYTKAIEQAVMKAALERGGFQIDDAG